MKKIIERLIAALAIILVACFVAMIVAYVIDLSLTIKNEIRKDQERTVCNKLGGRYNVLEECLAVDGKALVMPIKR